MGTALLLTLTACSSGDSGGARQQMDGNRYQQTNLVADRPEYQADFTQEDFVNAHRNYYTRNEARMKYQNFKERNIPRGSGAVESAIRRVINMRLKGAGSFWLRDNAQSMILLRSYLKAGRFDDLMDWSITMATPWWSVPEAGLEAEGEYHASKAA